VLHPVTVGPPAREDGFSPSGRGGAKPHHEVTPKAPLPEGEVPSWLCPGPMVAGWMAPTATFPSPRSRRSPPEA
jgi:hypothetical protein